jgi:hypothetical protein
MAVAHDDFMKHPVAVYLYIPFLSSTFDSYLIPRDLLAS